MSNQYTSIGVLEETKKQLDSFLVKSQTKNGERLTYDKCIKMLLVGRKI